MASFNDLSLSERLFIKGYPFQRFARHKNNPASMAITPLSKPLSQCTVALVTTAGLTLPGQPPFDASIKMGDSSFREIPGTLSPQELEIHHRSHAFSQDGIRLDRNLIFPLDRLHEMHARAEIGAVAPYHYSFMGSIPGPSKLIRETAPEVAQRLVSANVDVVLLTPA
jgi:D-proline reductase (dithiol) PrdB